MSHSKLLAVLDSLSAGTPLMMTSSGLAAVLNSDRVIEQLVLAIGDVLR